MELNPDVQRLKNLSRLPLSPPKQKESPVTFPPLASVLDQVETMMLKYLTLPDPHFAMVLALWIANTYTYHLFDYCGYLNIRSATPRCGKTKVLELLELLAEGTPPITTQPTPAVLFRSTRKVILLDEVDKLRNKDKDTYGEVMAILNCRFKRGSSVERVERGEKGMPVKSYPVYGPVAFAGIESVTDTLEDRSFHIQMQRATHRMPRFNKRIIGIHTTELQAAMKGWAEAHADDLTAAYDSIQIGLPVLDGFDDRLQDISEPLVILASLADAERSDGHGEKILPRLLAGLKAAAGKRETSWRERALLSFLDMVTPRLDGRPDVFLSTAELLTAFQQRDDELSRIESGRALAGFLKQFDLLHGTNTENTIRGYTVTLEWVKQWRERYEA